MNTTRQLLTVAAIAAASLLSAGAALAQEASPDTWQQVQSATPRADVIAELAAARQSGQIRAVTEGYMEPVRQQALRAEVRASTLQAIASGELRAINAEAPDDTPLSVLRLAQAGQ